MFQPVPPLVTPNLSLYTAIKNLGLETNLKLVLDAGDVQSYIGSGQSWVNRVDSSVFVRGDTGPPDTDDPTFNGVAGALSANEYWSVDGGDCFSKQTANDQWMKDFGKAGKSQTVFGIVYIPAGASSFPLFSTLKPTSTMSGANFDFDSSSGKFGWLSADSAGTGLNSLRTASPAITLPGLFFVGGSLALTGSADFAYNVRVNELTGSSSGTAASNYHTSDPALLAHLLADASLAHTAPNGVKLYALAIWVGSALADAYLQGLYELMKPRFGL